MKSTRRLRHSSKNTPLLQALECYHAQCRVPFTDMHEIMLFSEGKSAGKSLLDRGHVTCTQRGIPLIRKICDEGYGTCSIGKDKMFDIQNEGVDSIMYLLLDLTDKNIVLPKGLVSQSF